MKITYEQIKVLNPCWSNKDLQEELPLGKEIELTIDSLIRLNKLDARWLVSRLMTRPMLVVWAQTCAKRARKYAARSTARSAATWSAADAADAAAYAADAADAAAYAADYAADAAADSAAADARSADAADARSASSAEHLIAMKHAISLLNGKGIK